MNNGTDGFNSFWFWLAVVANYCQIESYELNLKQTSNDEIMKHLQYQDEQLLNKIIQQNNEIIKLLKGDKNAPN